MSYRPDDQALQPPCKKIIEGIVDFDKVVDSRMTANEWQGSHLTEIHEIRCRLMEFKGNLQKICNDTW